LSGPEAKAPPRAVIFGCSGPRLSPAERRFFTEADPLGFILFHRNCKDAAEVGRLVAALRAAVGRADAPVLIDQEGGRVQRLKPPLWPRHPPAAAIGRLAAADPEAGARAAHLNARAIAATLAPLGISHCAAPVLDLAIPGADAVIGDRAFSGDPALVARLGRAAAEGFLAGGIVPIVKHLPGHGRTRVDSHRALPVVEEPLAVLEASDFAPFRALADLPWGMTGHLVFTAIDPARPATQSPVVVSEVIRGAIGFEGVLVSDDLSMEALAGSIEERAGLAIAAGCDLALHCNGTMAEMERVAAVAPRIGEATCRRLARAAAWARLPAGGEPFALAADVEGLLAAAWSPVTVARPLG
jgi:beta-N-acetylhexosaminidase